MRQRRNPEVYGDLPEKMDQTSIEKAYKEKRSESAARRWRRVQFRRASSACYMRTRRGHTTTAVRGVSRVALSNDDGRQDRRAAISDLCEEEAVLSLWATSPLLHEALMVMKGRGDHHKAASSGTSSARQASAGG